MFTMIMSVRSKHSSTHAVVLTAWIEPPLWRENVCELFGIGSPHCSRNMSERKERHVTR